MIDKKKPRDMMRFFKRMVVLAILLWTVFSLGSMAYHIFDSEKLVTQLAYQAAQQSIEKEKIYRLWASEHGGVYVPVSQKTPPNQYLSYVAERDITTLQGKRLTLVNPAYMTRQVHELMAKNTGVKGHITSLNPIRAENRPDEWEAQALKKIEGGAEDFGEVTTMDGVSFYRLMIPLRTEGPCLKCHAAQGYKSGDIRGGISAAVPMERFDAIRRAHIIDEVKHFGSVWFLGVAGIFIGSRFVKQRIDERDSAEKSLRESEGKYRSLFVNNPVPMLVFDAETLAFLAVNDFAVDHYGYSREEFMSMTIKDIRPPEDIPHLQKVLKEEAGILRRDIYARHRKKDGSLIDVEIAAHEIDFEGHSAVLVLASDITERRRTEAAFRESEKMLRTIIDSEPECVKLVSPEGLLIDMNPAGLAMIDADSLDLVKGQPLVTFVTEPHRDAFNRLGAEVFSGKEGRLEFEIVGLKGRRLWMETHAVPLRDEKNSIFAMLAITRDVTERKKAEEQHRRLEEQLMHAQKMEAVGQLAGGVAHDFNNILTSVLGCAELLQMNIDRNSSQRTYVDYILESARRGVSLVRGLLVFSRKDVTYPLPLDLGRAVDESRPFIEKVVSENYELLITHQDDLVVMADRHQIEQVLINLVSNARDAMPSGGTIAIEVAPAEFAEDCAFEGAMMKAGRYALLTVTDSGTGIDDRVRERVFEPFFTTKEVGKGTGLGLSIVYGIVKQHGGFIRLHSTPGAGTTVQVYLPLIEEHKEKDRLGDEQLPRGGDETILLAEDDAIVREITSNLLREFGYTVLVAADGLEAVKMIRDTRDAIKLLLLDVIMPKMSGREVYEKAREVWPEAKTLMMSGYSGDHLEGLPSESETLRFLEKPVPPLSLLSAVRSMLDGKEPTGSATLT